MVLGRLVFHALLALLQTGLLFHRPLLPGDAPAHFAFTAALTLLHALPFALAHLRARLGPRRFAFALTPAAALALAAYAVASALHANLQSHAFDPFLQIAPSPPPESSPSPLDAAGSSAALRVVALGGSTTRNEELPPADRYPARIEAVLTEALPGRRVTVHNAGMDWWSTKHSLAHYVDTLRAWQPQVVVVMHGINDLYRSFSDPCCAVGAYDRRWSHFYGPAIRGARPESFEDRWLGVLGARWFSRLRVREAPVAVERFVSIADSERHLRTLLALVQRDGALPVVITQPSLYRAEPSAEVRERLRFGRLVFKERYGYFRIKYPGPASLGAALDAHNAMARRVAHERGAPLVDAARSLPPDLDHFLDDVHYTRTGSRLLGQLVGERVGERFGETLAAPLAATP